MRDKDATRDKEGNKMHKTVEFVAVCEKRGGVA